MPIRLNFIFMNTLLPFLKGLHWRLTLKKNILENLYVLVTNDIYCIKTYFVLPCGRFGNSV